jgi:hypothetical protein
MPEEGKLQGLKPRFVAYGERPEAKALGYLEAMATATTRLVVAD